MAKPKKTRKVDRVLYVNYLKRAEECANAMQRAYDAGEWNACVINAIHAAIAAADALSVYALGLRPAGESHSDAVDLFASIEPRDRAMRANAARLSKLLAIKNVAEYEEKLQRQSQADNALRDASRFLAFVRNKLPRGER